MGGGARGGDWHLVAELLSCESIPEMADVLSKPSVLKPDHIKRIESNSDEELRLVHEVLLHGEKDRLRRDISDEAKDERTSGKWERLPEIISEVRSQMRHS